MSQENEDPNCPSTPKRSGPERKEYPSIKEQHRKSKLSVPSPNFALLSFFKSLPNLPKLNVNLSPDGVGTIIASCVTGKSRGPEGLKSDLGRTENTCRRLF